MGEHQAHPRARERPGFQCLPLPVSQPHRAFLQQLSAGFSCELRLPDLKPAPLKHFRAIATGFEKHDANYLALVKLAAARIWMRIMSR
jgi:hypothetical protein